MKTIISSSIVAYKTDHLILQNVLCALQTSAYLHYLYIVDNSPTDELRKICIDSKINYIHNPSNPGFGAAHNIAITQALKQGSQYHFIVNPDIHIKDDAITTMVDFIIKNPNVGMMMPQILNNDGSVQNLPKLLPNPFSVLMRKLKWPSFLYQPFIDKYELRFVPKDKIYEAPILSGCFTLLNLEAIKKIGLYDDRYFMYFEDWDLSRRMHEKYQTIYYPKVSVYHGYESGANKNIQLFKIYITSAFRYFNKWGWFLDSNRKKFNENTLNQF